MVSIRNLIVLILAVALSVSSAVQAAEKKSKSEAVSRQTYKSLEKAQKLLVDGKNQQALTKLQALYAKIDKSTMDEAVVSQMLGYAAMGTNDYARAITYFKKSLNLGLMPEKTNHNMRYMLAQLLGSKKQYKEAIQYASKWYSDEPQIKSSQHMFMANLYLQSKQYKKAIPFVNKAIAAEKKPKESWYQLLVGSYYELKQYDKAAVVLKKMIGNWPGKKAYWEQLAGIYLKLDKESDSLALLELAWRKGVLEKESSIKTLVQYAIGYGIPERAARILDTAIKQKKLTGNIKNLQVLARAWTRAKEVNKAISSYQNLVKVSGSGKHMTQLARLYIEQEDWPNAQKWLQSAVSKPGVDQGKTYLLLGITQVQANQLDDAKQTLRKAAAFGKTKRQANTWINYAKQKQQSQNRMAKAETT